MSESCENCGSHTDGLLCESCEKHFEFQCAQRNHAHDYLELMRLRAMRLAVEDEMCRWDEARYSQPGREGEWSRLLMRSLAKRIVNALNQEIK
jgi:hypothetical protein